MSKDENVGPAFPANDWNKDQRGMSLRDWFAGQAIAGICASSLSERQAKLSPEELRKQVGDAAYIIADAMIAARSWEEE